MFKEDIFSIRKGRPNMPLTASFSEVRRNLTAITDKVMKDRVQITVIKHNKPAFKIVPIDTNNIDAQSAYLAADAELNDEYHDVFEALAR